MHSSPASDGNVPAVQRPQFVAASGFAVPALSCKFSDMGASSWQYTSTHHQGAFRHVCQAAARASKPSSDDWVGRHDLWDKPRNPHSHPRGNPRHKHNCLLKCCRPVTTSFQQAHFPTSNPCTSASHSSTCLPHTRDRPCRSCQDRSLGCR